MKRHALLALATFLISTPASAGPPWRGYKPLQTPIAAERNAISPAIQRPSAWRAPDQAQANDDFITRRLTGETRAPAR